MRGPLNVSTKEVEIGGEKYKLSPLDLNDAIEFEDTIGPLSSPEATQSLRGFRFLLWAMMRKSHDGLSQEDAGRLVMMADLAEVAGWVNEMMGAPADAEGTPGDQFRDIRGAEKAGD